MFTSSEMNIKVPQQGGYKCIINFSVFLCTIISKHRHFFYFLTTAFVFNYTSLYCTYRLDTTFIKTSRQNFLLKKLTNVVLKFQTDNIKIYKIMLFNSRCVYERTEKVELSEKMELKVSNDDFRSLNNYDF